MSKTKIKTSDNHIDCIKLTVESLQKTAKFHNISLSDESFKFIANVVLSRLRMVIDDAVTVMHAKKKTKLTIADVSAVVKMSDQAAAIMTHNIPTRKFIKDKSGVLKMLEEVEYDLEEVSTKMKPKLPLDIVLHTHWLAIDGLQPAIPENPPNLSKKIQMLESADPAAMLDIMRNDVEVAKLTEIKRKAKNIEMLHMKQLASHELSVEQQLYYKEVTEACMGDNDKKRSEALQSLSVDPGLSEMLPRLCTFIAEGIRINIVQRNGDNLWYLLYMTNALLNNRSLVIEKYLHDLLPAVISCIVSKHLSLLNLEHFDHFDLRDKAAAIVAYISRAFNSNINNIQARLTRVFTKVLNDDQAHFSSIYGAATALCQMGPNCAALFIMPRVKALNERICSMNEEEDGEEAVLAGRLQHSLIDMLVPILPDIMPLDEEAYYNLFGDLGRNLFICVSASLQQYEQMEVEEDEEEGSDEEDDEMEGGSGDEEDGGMAALCSEEIVYEEAVEIKKEETMEVGSPEVTTID